VDRCVRYRFHRIRQTTKEKTVQAVVITRFGDPSGITVSEVQSPRPSAKQLLIKTEAIGVGGVDAVIRRGTLGLGFAPGMIPGSEVAGTVISVGDDADASWVGRRVWAFTGREGGYAELALADVDDVSPIPDGLTSIDARPRSPTSPWATRTSWPANPS
jgi:NADPH2:quinone reductase